MHPVLGLFRRNAWATRELLSFCQGLPPQMTAAPASDVYGSIDSLFNHLLAAEGRYLRHVTGELPEPAADEKEPRPLAELAEAAEAAAQRWEALLREDHDFETPRERRRGEQVIRMPDWVPSVQAIHHGDDHRTQVNTLLGRRGVE